MDESGSLMKKLPRTREERSRDAALALAGLSLGDALGQHFLRQGGIPKQNIARRALPPAPWRYSDDTEMALSVVEVLTARGLIEQELLARAFARRFEAAPDRGYGAVAYKIL